MSAEAAVALVDRLAVTSEQQDLTSISTALRVPTYYIVADLQSLRPFDHKTFDAGARVVSNRLTRLSPLEAWTKPATATDYFARAAYLAAKPSGTTFLDDLETALSRPGFRDGFDSDPSFANLLGPPPDPDPLQDVRVRFKELMGNPGLTSYLELSPFVPWSAQLLASGFDELTDMAPLPPAVLASRLKVPHTVAQQWSDLAQLAARMLLEPPQDLSVHDLEVLALLVECRVTSIEGLHRSLSQDPERLYADLVTAARRRQVVPTREATVARWIDLCQQP